MIALIANTSFGQNVYDRILNDCYSEGQAKSIPCPVSVNGHLPEKSIDYIRYLNDYKNDTSHGTLSGQCVIEESSHVTYNYDSRQLNYTEYVVKNKTQDTIYVWIDTDTAGNDSLTLEHKNIWLFFKYIRAPKCELGLDFLCHDGSINYVEGFPPPPVIGCTFIRKIIPDESFTIISIDKGVDKDAIHYVRQEVVSHFFRIERLDEFCYDKPYILVW